MSDFGPADSAAERGADHDFQLTLVELSRACGAREEQLRVWVLEGVIEPIGERPQDWRFPPPALRRARLAARLTQDLDLNPPGAALALDLLDQIAELKARLRRLGSR